MSQRQEFSRRPVASRSACTRGLHRVLRCGVSSSHSSTRRRGAIWSPTLTCSGCRHSGLSAANAVQLRVGQTRLIARVSKRRDQRRAEAGGRGDVACGQFRIDQVAYVLRCVRPARLGKRQNLALDRAPPSRRRQETRRTPLRARDAADGRRANHGPRSGAPRPAHRGLLAPGRGAAGIAPARTVPDIAGSGRARPRPVRPPIEPLSQRPRDCGAEAGGAMIDASRQV